MGAPSGSRKTAKNEQPVFPSKMQEKPVTSKKQSVSNMPMSMEQKSEKTKIVVKCNCGFSNALYIRGQGIPGLSWDHGIQMKNTKADEWTWETDKPFKQAEFKVLLNDKQFEAGENHNVSCGKSCSIKPSF